PARRPAPPSSDPAIRARRGRGRAAAWSASPGVVLSGCTMCASSWSMVGAPGSPGAAWGTPSHDERRERPPLFIERLMGRISYATTSWRGHRGPGRRTATWRGPATMTPRPIPLRPDGAAQPVPDDGGAGDGSAASREAPAGLATRQVHAGYTPGIAQNTVAVPVYQSVAYRFDSFAAA